MKVIIVAFFLMAGACTGPGCLIGQDLDSDTGECEPVTKAETEEHAALLDDLAAAEKELDNAQEALDAKDVIIAGKDAAIENLEWWIGQKNGVIMTLGLPACDVSITALKEHCDLRVVRH